VHIEDPVMAPHVKGLQVCQVSTGVSPILWPVEEDRDNHQRHVKTQLGSMGKVWLLSNVWHALHSTGSYSHPTSLVWARTVRKHWNMIKIPHSKWSLSWLRYVYFLCSQEVSLSCSNDVSLSWSDEVSLSLSKELSPPCSNRLCCHSPKLDPFQSQKMNPYYVPRMSPYHVPERYPCHAARGLSILLKRVSLFLFMDIFL